MRRSIVTGIVLLVTFGMLYAMLDSVVDYLFGSLVFQPTAGAQLSPEALGIDAESIYLTTEDGVKIHAFYLPGPSLARASCAVLFLHGNAGNSSHRLPNAVELMRLGCAVLVVDYRGYGLSEGSPTEQGSYRDARAGLAYLVDRGFPTRAIVLFGRSLGGAVAIDLAQDREFAGVVLESTFTSIADVARTVGGEFMSFFAGRRYDSIRKIARVRSPLLFLHGDRDEVIDYDLGLRLFDAAPAPKQFQSIPGAGHNDTMLIGGRAYLERIRRFIDEVIPRRGDS